MNGTCIIPNYFSVSDDPTNAGPRKPEVYFTMQNVPGDGDCMFLAVALAAAKSAYRSATPDIDTASRSEERRVGKECRP